MEAAGLINEDGAVRKASRTHAIDIIGIIQEPTGEVLEDEEGADYPEMAPVGGFHANYRGDELPEALAQFEIPAPDNPVRVWA